MQVGPPPLASPGWRTGSQAPSPLGTFTSTWRSEAFLFTSWLVFWAAGAGSVGLCCSSCMSSLGRVLSSQFLALCKLHPVLVVELAKELLEFVGSASSPLGTGLMCTSVVRLPTTYSSP